MRLVAHPLVPKHPEIVPAPRKRDWMQTDANPNRCLPFSIACQSGWWVLNPVPFTATRRKEYVEVTYDEGWDYTRVAKQHFGGGMVTIDLPFMFRTEPGWDLRIGPPSNLPLPGAYCLEAIVETDWSTATVAVSWLLTDEDRPVRFEHGFPACQLTPVKRGYLQEFEPSIEFSETALREYVAYFESREGDFLGDQATVPSERLDGYFRGERPDGSRFEGQHLQRLDLKPFA